MPNTVKQGFEGQLLYGAAGSTGATLIENCKDITVTRDVEFGNTTVRGDSTAPPIETQAVTLRKLEIEFTTIYDTSDTVVEALLTAEAAGTAIALRAREYSSGKGPDADFYLSASQPWPLQGEQVITFKAVATRGYGREPERRV